MFITISARPSQQQFLKRLAAEPEVPWTNIAAVEAYTNAAAVAIMDRPSDPNILPIPHLSTTVMQEIRNRLYDENDKANGDERTFLRGIDTAMNDFIKKWGPGSDFASAYVREKVRDGHLPRPEKFKLSRRDGDVISNFIDNVYAGTL